MSENKITRTPWFWSGNSLMGAGNPGSFGSIHILSFSKDPKNILPDPEHREHIVHAVNTYEEREALLKEMREGLEDAKHQIEYMHKKFQRTGSGNQVLSRIETLLSKHTS